MVDRGGAGLLLVLAIAAGMAFAGSASAGTPGPTVSLGKSKQIEYFKATYVDVVTQTGQPVQCDGDAEVTGGGGSIAGPASSSALNESYPMPESGWQVEATSTAGPRKLTGYAVCGPVDLQYVVSQSSLPDGATSFATAVCPDPIGGGLGATGPGMRPILTKPQLPPSTAGWASGMTNLTMNDTLFDYYAICGSYNVKFRRNATELGKSKTAKVVARCKKDEAVLGGGYSGDSNGITGFQIVPQTTRPWDSKNDKNKVPDDGWLVKATSDADQKINLASVAACKR